MPYQYLSDPELEKFAQMISTGWICFGTGLLGLTSLELDECENDAKSKKQAIVSMLKLWRMKNKEEASTQNLENLICLHKARGDPLLSAHLSYSRSHSSESRPRHNCSGDHSHDRHRHDEKQKYMSLKHSHERRESTHNERPAEESRQNSRLGNKDRANEKPNDSSSTSGQNSLDQIDPVTGEQKFSKTAEFRAVENVSRQNSSSNHSSCTEHHPDKAPTTLLSATARAINNIINSSKSTSGSNSKVPGSSPHHKTKETKDKSSKQPGYLIVRESSVQIPSEEGREQKFSKTAQFNSSLHGAEKAPLSPDIFSDRNDEPPGLPDDTPSATPSFNRGNRSISGLLTSSHPDTPGNGNDSLQIAYSTPPIPRVSTAVQNTSNVSRDQPTSFRETRPLRPDQHLTPSPSPEPSLTTQLDSSPMSSSQSLQPSSQSSSSAPSRLMSNLSTAQRATLNRMCKYLEKYYLDRLSKINVLPFAEEHSVTEIYSEVYLFKEVKDAIQGGNQHSRPLSSCDDIFFSEEAKTSSGRRILVGDGGSGKTTLTAKFAADWANRKKNHSSPWRDKVLFVIPLRLVSNGMTFLQALNNIMPKELNMSEKEFDDLIFKIQEDIFIILDGWDEIDPSSFKGDEGGLNIVDIAYVKQLYSANVLITMRRFALSQFQSCEHFAFMEVEGFSTDEQKRKYIKKSMKTDYKVRQVWDLIKKHSFLQTISKTPLFLALLCELTLEINILDPQDVASVKKMVPFLNHCWNTFIRHCKSKMQKEQGNCFSEHKFEENVEEMTDKLGLVALDGIMEQKQTWQKAKLIDKIGKSNFDLAQKCGFIKVTSPEWNVTTRQGSRAREQYQGQQEMVGFFHKLFQEKCGGAKLGALAKSHPENFQEYLDMVTDNQEQVKLMDCTLKCACFMGGHEATEMILSHLIRKKFDHRDVNHVLFECLYEAHDENDSLWGTFEAMNEIKEVCLNAYHDSYSQDAIIGGLQMKNSLETLELKNCRAMFNRTLVKNLSGSDLGLLIIDGRATSVLKEMGPWPGLRNINIKNSKHLSHWGIKALMTWALDAENLETIRFEKCKFNTAPKLKFEEIPAHNTFLEVQPDRKRAAFRPVGDPTNLTCYRLHIKENKKEWKRSSKKNFVKPSEDNEATWQMLQGPGAADDDTVNSSSSNSPEPVKCGPMPFSVSSVPVSNSPEPVKCGPMPFSVSSVPVSKEQVPDSVRLSLASMGPGPAIARPVPAIARPVPAIARPVPVIEGPVHVIEGPVHVMEGPFPTSDGPVLVGLLKKNISARTETMQSSGVQGACPEEINEQAQTSSRFQSRNSSLNSRDSSSPDITEMYLPSEEPEVFIISDNESNSGCEGTSAEYIEEIARLPQQHQVSRKRGNDGQHSSPTKHARLDN